MTGAWLFDLYARGSEMTLWFVTEAGTRLRLTDVYTPDAYLCGAGRDVARCLDAMERAGDARAVGWTERRDFWTGELRRVFAVRVLRCETWRFALQRHAERFPDIAWYNADLPPEQTYCYERDLFPLMRCRLAHDGERLLSITPQDERWSTEYEAPPLRMIELTGEGTLRGKHPSLRSLTLTEGERSRTWDERDGMLEGLQRTLDELDPDVILTDHGDSFLLPLLFTLAGRANFPLRLDREQPPQPRRISLDGQSYFSYGRILYQAPEYSLYGRWHLDRRNSFTIGHEGMEGLFEVARLSRIPVQRLARRSIGTGITSIQLDLAWREGFLIPWKKTQPEAWKTARQLLKTDRGGLVYAPEVGFHENVVELDFISMYPSIMSRFNVSPETVNCCCCRNSHVPEIGYTLCEKRDGLVARALAPIIGKRIRYKALRKAAKATGDREAYTRFDSRQGALKWMLVCCFGYLGYRNARFGRIEAHESVSAFSREMLLRAREVCEAHGWRMLHANVDCVWIVKPGFRDEEIEELCERIGGDTGLSIALEGIYRWIGFLPSRQVADRPVPTRYFGAFRDGTLKYRGIECRRHDLPGFVKSAQLTLLTELARATDAAAYRAMMPEILQRMDELEGRLWRHEVPLTDLLIHQSLSQEPGEYTGSGAQSLAARQAHESGLGFHAGETLSYLLTASRRDLDKSRRVRLASLLDAETAADPEAYIRLLRRAMNTLLWPAGIQLDEERITPPWEAKARHVSPPARQLELFEART